jgi:hypothetical protein
MVSELNVLSLNLDSVIYLQFQLNILRIEHHLLKESLSSHMRESIKVLIKINDRVKIRTQALNLVLIPC